MVDFSGLVLTEGPPIYLQIINYVKRGIVGGTIIHLDEMPSRRVLSVQLGVNPNTIQKAYRMLEEEGFLLSQSGAKSVIQARTEAITKLRSELLGGEISALITSLQAMGTTKQQVFDLLDQLWEET